MVSLWSVPTWQPLAKCSLVRVQQGKRNRQHGVPYFSFYYFSHCNNYICYTFSPLPLLFFFLFCFGYLSSQKYKHLRAGSLLIFVFCSLLSLAQCLSHKSHSVNIYWWIFLTSYKQVWHYIFLWGFKWYLLYFWRYWNDRNNINVFKHFWTFLFLCHLF